MLLFESELDIFTVFRLFWQADEKIVHIFFFVFSLRFTKIDVLNLILNNYIFTLNLGYIAVVSFYGTDV